jgi:multidrug resistance efflux pump
MVMLESTRIRTEREGWFVLLNVEVGEIVATLWRNAKL